MAPQMGTQQLIGHRLVDNDGAAVGKIGQVFYDDQTDMAKWITVRTGLFGSRENLVPLVGAEMVYDALQVPWSRNKIKSAPSFDVDQHISVEQEDRVYAHYGLNPEIPGQRMPDGSDRPRGRHARPEPGGPAGYAQRGDERAAPQQDQRPREQIWEPNSEPPQSRSDESGRRQTWQPMSGPPQPQQGEWERPEAHRQSGGYPQPQQGPWGPQEVRAPSGGYPPAQSGEWRRAEPWVPDSGPPQPRPGEPGRREVWEPAGGPPQPQQSAWVSREVGEPGGEPPRPQQNEWTRRDIWEPDSGYSQPPRVQGGDGRM